MAIDYHRLESKCFCHHGPVYRAVESRGTRATTSTDTGAPKQPKPRRCVRIHEIVLLLAQGGYRIAEERAVSMKQGT